MDLEKLTRPRTWHLHRLDDHKCMNNPPAAVRFGGGIKLCGGTCPPVPPPHPPPRFHRLCSRSSLLPRPCFFFELGLGELRINRFLRLLSPITPPISFARMTLYVTIRVIGSSASLGQIFCQLCTQKLRPRNTVRPVVDQVWAPNKGPGCLPGLLTEKLFMKIKNRN